MTAAHKFTNSINFQQCTALEASYVKQSFTENALHLKADLSSGISKGFHHIYGRLSGINNQPQSMRSPMAKAIQKGNLSRVKKLMRQGAILSRIRDRGRSLLPTDLAINSRHKDILLFLLKLGEQLNTDSTHVKTALSEGWITEHGILALQLMHQSNQGKQGLERLHRAIEYKVDQRTFKSLIQSSQSLNHLRSDGHTPLSLALKYKFYDKAKALVLSSEMTHNKPYSHGKSVVTILKEELVKTPVKNRGKIYEILLELAKSRHVSFSTLGDIFHVLGESGDREQIKKLFKAALQKDIDLQRFVNVSDPAGNCLWQAIYSKDHEKLALLIQAGINLDLKSKGYTALQFAAGKSDLKLYSVIQNALKVKATQGSIQLDNIDQLAYNPDFILDYENIQDVSVQEKLASNFDIKVKPLFDVQHKIKPVGFILSPTHIDRVDLAFLCAHGRELDSFEKNEGPRLNFVSPAHYPLRGFAFDYVRAMQQSHSIEHKGMQYECNIRENTNAQYKADEYFRNLALAPSKADEYDVRRACQIMAYQKANNMPAFDFVFLDPALRKDQNYFTDLKTLNRSIISANQGRYYKDLLVYTCRTNDIPALAPVNEYTALDSSNPQLLADQRFFTKDTVPSYLIDADHIKESHIKDSFDVTIPDSSSATTTESDESTSGRSTPPTPMSVMFPLQLPAKLKDSDYFGLKDSTLFKDVV